jgi:serine/threonine protein kinase
MSAIDQSKVLPKPVNLRDYEISKTIGIGSHSVIKLAKTSQSNKFYSVKKIPKIAIMKLGLVEHIFNEIKTLSLSENIFIEKYQGYCQDEKYIYIITELMVGGSLCSLLRQEARFQVPQAS